MFLNGKEAKTVLLSTLSTTSTASQPPIVVLANGQNNSGHPNPMQLLPVLSSAVTSVAAAKHNEIKSVAAVTTTRNGETNNNNKVIYPWHSLVPFLGNILLVTNFYDVCIVSEGFLGKVAPPELKISPNVYFIMYNSVVLSKVLPICVP